MSRLSNCSRIWNMKTPRITMPTSTSSAMPSSTTIGIPYVALVAANSSPFSSARKPITWGMAFARVIIIMNDSSTQASAMPSVLRATEADNAEIGAASVNAKMTSTMPTSMVVGMLSSGSTSHLTARRWISRCSSHGSSSTFRTSVSAAEK